MPKRTLIGAAGLLFGLCVAIAQTDRKSPALPTSSTGQSINCRAMEVFAAEEPGATAVIFHQRDKADGRTVGEFILAHSGEELEFETTDGKRHRGTVFRVKSCFGRGLLLSSSGEARLAEGDEFVLRLPAKG